MKKGKGLTINLHFTNRWLYTFIVIGILAIIGVGVYAYGTTNPSTFGHSMGEMAPPAGCLANQYLQFDGTSWKCNTPPVGYSSLNDLKAAVSNDFHNLGGRDEGFGGMYVKKVSDGSCYYGNPYTSVPPAKSCTCPASGVLYNVRVVATLNIGGSNYELDYCDSSQSISGNF